MSDRLYLSYTLRGFTAQNQLRHFRRMLDLFPVSRLQPRALLRIYAVEYVEPALLEQEFAAPVDFEQLIQAAGEFKSPDCAYEVETCWDLWSYETEWKLAPASVTLICFGPEFLQDGRDHLRVDFGPDSRFLPQEGLPNAHYIAQSNLKSLLRLAHQLDEALPVVERRLWLESGENFAERLADAG